MADREEIFGRRVERSELEADSHFPASNDTKTGVGSSGRSAWLARMTGSSSPAEARPASVIYSISNVAARVKLTEPVSQIYIKYWPKDESCFDVRVS